MRAMMLVGVLLLVISAPAAAQNLDILSTIDEILATLSNLTDRLDEISEDIRGQSEQITNLDNTLNQINERWPEIQESAQFITDIRAKLTPLVERFPELESQLQSLDSLQASLSDRYEQLNSSLGKLTASIPGESGQELQQFRSEIDMLQESLSLSEAESQKLAGELNQLRIFNYIGLGILIMLLGLQAFYWIRRRPAQA